MDENKTNTAQLLQLRRWERIDRCLRSAIEVLESENGPIDIASVLDFLRNNELGLAYDELKSICDELDLNVSAVAETEIKEAKRLMGLPCDN